MPAEREKGRRGGSAWAWALGVSATLKRTRRMGSVAFKAAKEQDGAEFVGYQARLSQLWIAAMVICTLVGFCTQGHITVDIHKMYHQKLARHTELRRRRPCH